MLVDPLSVTLASHFLQDIQQESPRELSAVDVDELRKDLAEHIQQAVEEWFSDLPQMLEVGR